MSKNSTPFHRTFGKALLASFSLLLVGEASAQTVNIYSYRQPNLIEPVLNAFTEKTGIKTQVQFLKKGMVEKLSAEGRNSPADVILTTDIARLTQFANEDLVEPLSNTTIEQNVPASFREESGKWFGLTMRGRVLYASKERVSEDTITYEDLADPKWKGKICSRSGQHVYNVALFASIIAHKGSEGAEAWLKGVKANLARKPDGNDRAQARGIFSGECDIGIGNTYYVGLMINNEKEPEQKEWANSMKVLFPNSEGRGTHVNVSGMALAKYSPNRDSAVKLMEFLSSKEAQQIYAEQVYEYPVMKDAGVSDTVASFGTLNPDPISLEKIAKLRKEASQLVDKVGYDDGPES